MFLIGGIKQRCYTAKNQILNQKRSVTEIALKQQECMASLRWDGPSLNEGYKTHPSKR